jgi:DNA-directed RNA polymerase alpha subunit
MSKSDLLFLLSKLPSNGNVWERVTKAVMNALTKEELSDVLTTVITENEIALLKVTQIDPDRIESLHLSARAENCLRAEGVLLVSDLLTRSGPELRKFINLGKGSLKEIETALARRGQQLKE